MNYRLKSTKLFFLLQFFFAFISIHAFCQNDSLKTLVNNCKTDTAKFRLCNEISLQYSAKDNATAIYFANEARKIAEQEKDTKGEGVAINNLAYAIYYSGQNDSAKTLFNLALAISKKCGDENIAAFAYNRLGFLAREQGDNALAIKYYHQSLQANNGEKNIPEAAFSYLNIGVVYDDEKNFKEALSYEESGLKLYKQTNDNAKIANCFARIGNVHMNMKDSTTALAYYQEALPLFDKGNSKRGVAICLNNIAMILETRHQLDKALEYYFKALAIRETIGDKNGMAIIYNNIGTNYESSKDYEKAILYYNKGLDLAYELGFTELIELNNFGLSTAYEKSGDTKKALDYFKLYHNWYDTLFNNEKSKQINELNSLFDSERNTKKIELLSKDAKISADELEKKNTQTWFLIAGLIAVALFSFLIFRSAIKSRKANAILREQKNEISMQKKKVDEQNRDIIDSINYAKRIQHAVLPSQDEMQNLFPNSFVYFRPRDIVSGDFWWIGQQGKIKIIAVADCTGHGVPGAFMSLIGNTGLNEVVKEKHISDPGEILNQLAINIISALKQDNKEISTDDYSMGLVKDGMDIAIICIDEEKGELKFAGANNPIYFVSNGEMHEIKGDRQPVGIFTKELKPFTVHSLSIKELDAVYIFTDGYADQFGGETGKKFKYSQLKQLLFDIHEKSTTEQENELERAFQSWKGKLDQVDDILVAGIKL